MRSALVIMLIMLIAVCVQTQTYKYVRDTTGLGAGNYGDFTGDDWANAYDEPPATLNRGTIYLFADGTYLEGASYTIDDAISGTAYVTWKKATVDSHGTDVGWNTSMGDGQSCFYEYQIKTSYVAIDGSTHGDTGGFFPDSNKYGFKCLLRNTTTLNHYLIKAPHSYQMDYINIYNIFFSGKGLDSLDPHEQCGIYVGGDHQTDYYHIAHCFFSQLSNPIIMYRSDYSIVERCFFYKNWSKSGYANGQSFSPGILSDSLTFRYNKVYDPTIFIFGTHAIESDGEFGWKVHHNVFVGLGNEKPVQAGVASANATVDTNSIVGAHIYNNTFMNFDFGRGAVYIGPFTLSDKNLIRNNLFYNIIDADMSDTVSMDKDNNFFINCSGSFRIDSTDSVLNSTTIFADTANFDFRLQSPLISGYEPTGYETDFAGNTRGINTDWSVGAYGYTGDTPAPQRNRLAKCWLRIED